jgi:hypothetical protein
MNREQRLPLLERMSLLTHEEAENLTKHAQTFLPLPSHRLALRPEIVVVRGGRGAGKSALFQLLKELGPGVQQFFEDDRIADAIWMDAFSDAGLAHPSVMALDTLASSHASDASLRAFWLSHLLARMSKEGLISSSALPVDFEGQVTAFAAQPERWIGWAERNTGAISATLDDVERALNRRTLFATYDHLDRLGQHDRATRGRYVASLLSMWLSLSNRYQRLRAKIFLRDDLFDAAERSFADASKLRPRSVSLEWSVEDLYRAAVRHLAAPPPGERESSQAMIAWLEGVPKLELAKHGTFGLIPGPMPEASRKAFAKELAGELMGTGAKKGFTFRWIPNRLQDAKTRIVPRSMLNLLGFAAMNAAKKPLNRDRRLLTPSDLAGALPQVSKKRANEVAQEYPLVGRLENLSGQRVLLERSLVVAKLAQPIANEQKGLSVDGELVLEELVDLGVLSIRETGKIDVPDIYRYGFKIKRKGGVAQPK